jgi:hypothetical protein
MFRQDVFQRLRPHRHRFMLSASCRTSNKALSPTLVWLRYVWHELSEVPVATTRRWEKPE